MNEEDIEISNEIEVLKHEFEFVLKEEVTSIFNEIRGQINIILHYLTKSVDKKPTTISQIINQSRIERLNLIPTQTGLDGIKCSLNMSANELSYIEINYKLSQRHNNFVYKSKEESTWHLHQISNCGDTLKTLVSYISNLDLPFISYEQAMFHIEHLLDEVNAARNILLIPKKRLIPELQNQKNMKIFPMIPNDLVFSFYLQGFKLILAIYSIKGSETMRYSLECNIPWINNIMILLTSCLQKLQQLKDKVNIFDQFNVIVEQNQPNIETKRNKKKKDSQKVEDHDCATQKCVFHL